MRPITILGLGNPLLKDDGIGPRVVRELQKKGLPPGVAAVEAAGSLFQYWDLFARSGRLIVVDAFSGGGPPGTVYLLTPGQLSRNAPKKETALFQHEDDFLGFLDLLAHFGVKPPVTIVGVEPKEVTYSLELSPEIAARLPAILKIIFSLFVIRDDIIHPPA
ncbi:MAG: hydrogenase maturation protease [Bacillota bacterium]